MIDIIAWKVEKGWWHSFFDLRNLQNPACNGALSPYLYQSRPIYLGN